MPSQGFRVVQTSIESPNLPQGYGLTIMTETSDFLRYPIWEFES